MIAILTIIYTGLVVLLFKFKILRPRPYPIAGVVVAGVLLIGGVVIAWRLFAPMSGRVVTSQYVIQLVPYVKGQVKKIYARANQPMKRGALLLEIDPTPFQYKVNQLEAQLQASRDKVTQAEAALKAARDGVKTAVAGVRSARFALNQAEAAVISADAALNKALAKDNLARTEENIALDLRKTDAGAISTLRVAQAIQNKAVADAAVAQARGDVTQAGAGAQQRKAQLAQAESAELQAESEARQAEAAVQVARSNVPAVQAQLDDARFNLAQCRVTAPSDGYVVNWQVQEGTMLVPMPMAAAGTFINTEETFIMAAFPQNQLPHVQPGDVVEVVLDPYPGALFKAKVENVITATGEGQYDPSGTIPQAAKVGSHGLLAVKIRLTDPPPGLTVPLGSGGYVAVYTDRGKPVHAISKVVIRMKRWLSYIIPS